LATSLFRAHVKASQASKIAEHLVETEGLEVRREVAHHVVELARVDLVAVEPSRKHDQVGTETSRDDARHGTSNAEAARLVAGARDDPAFANATDADGLSLQGGVVEYLYRGEEGVEVDVEKRCLIDQRSLRRRDQHCETIRRR
jgi:hypothetical protein